MKKVILVLFILAASNNFAQIDLTAGMGISLLNNSSLTDYINSNFAPPGEKLADFNTVVNFMGEGTFPINEKFDIGIEYAYSIFSYNTSYGGFGNYDLTYGKHMPTIVAYYVVKGDGYKFKLGGGAGMRVVSLTEKITIEESFSTLGAGMLLRAEGHTKLSGNFYASILGSFRYDLPGEPKDGNNMLVDNISKTNVNLNAISFGLTLGVSYFF